MWGPKRNLGPIGSAVSTFIGCKQTNRPAKSRIYIVVHYLNAWNVQFGFMKCNKRNWVFVTNSDFLIPSFQPNIIDLRYFKLWILLEQINVWTPWPICLKFDYSVEPRKCSQLCLNIPSWLCLIACMSDHNSWTPLSICLKFWLGNLENHGKVISWVGWLFVGN